MEPSPPVRLEREPAIAYAFAGLVPIAAGAALVSVREEVVTANLALIMVLTVVLAAAFGGRGPGVAAAFAATLSFDFFLTRPYLSLTIDRAEDIETAIVLLLIGLAVGQIAVWARRARRAARRGSDDIHRLHRVGELAASGAAIDDIVQTVEAELVDLLHLESCHFDTGVSLRVLPQLERSGVITGVHIHYFAGRDFALPEQGVELAVRARGHSLGRLTLEPDPAHGVSFDERLVAVALADQLGAALASSASPADS